MYPIAILAGGLASRMYPRTSTIPKALLEVAGRPFIDHQLTLIRRQGLTSVVLCVGHLGEHIQAFVGDGSRWSLQVNYSHDGDVLRGTGGAIRQALPQLGARFFVMYGDSYLTCRFADVADAFDRSRRAALMTVFRNAGAFDVSNVLFEHGRIVRYDKRETTPAMRHIDYGLSVFEADAIARYPDDSVFDLAGVFQDLIATGQLAGLEVPDRFFEIGSPQGLLDTEGWLMKEQA